MSTQAHTEGPWPSPEYDNHGNGGFSEWWNVGGIAEVHTSEADAHLISAAPELLAALKMARECIAYCRRAHKDAQSGEGVPVEIFLDAAIAKAEGRS